MTRAHFTGFAGSPDRIGAGRGFVATSGGSPLSDRGSDSGPLAGGGKAVIDGRGFRRTRGGCWR